MSAGLLVLRGGVVSEIMRSRETEILACVRDAYSLHHRGKSVLPHSVFLRFPGGAGNRIIALPAYLGGDYHMAGLKWIASFPGNRQTGKERASAVVVLNSMETGEPIALLEGSAISAARTAASAFLALQYLRGREPVKKVALIGAGRINFEVLRFFSTGMSSESFCVHDTDPGRTRQFVGLCAERLALDIHPAASGEDAWRGADLISFATTAPAPWVGDLVGIGRGAMILHISLRDLHPSAVRAARNVVDDGDHVCRENTTLALALMEQPNSRPFELELGEIFNGRSFVPDERTTIFHPFGLGILDLAVATFVYRHALAHDLGTSIELS